MISGNRRASCATVAIVATSQSRVRLPELQSWPTQGGRSGCILGAMELAPQLHTHLAAWREVKGLSQEQVANILGVNKSTIHRWETGKRTMDLSDLARLSEVYGVEPVALLLSPSDHELARRLTSALAVLRAAPEAVADRWLQIGADLSGATLPKMQQDC